MSSDDREERDCGHHYEGPERRYAIRLSSHDIESIATVVAKKVSAHQACNVFTLEEINSVKGLLKTQKNVVRITLWVMAALTVWILKDVYMWIVKNLSFVWGGK